MARRAFEVVRAKLTPAMTEIEVAAELEYQARRFGAKGLSFEPIVGVGARAALPHGRATNKRIGEGDFTLIDWGVNAGLYMSDLTRIMVTGKISPKLRKLYGVVLKAQLAGDRRDSPRRHLRGGRRGGARRSSTRPASASTLGTAWATARAWRFTRPRGWPWARKTKLRAGNDRDGRAGHLFARLGRRADRGRHAGHAHGPRSADRVPKELDECIVA